MYGTIPFTARVLSAALVIGTVTTTIVAAPGFNKAIRVVGGVLSLTRSATGIVDVILKDGGGVTFVWSVSGMSVGGTPMSALILPEPGIQLPSNTALVCDATSTTATGNAAYHILYLIDNL